MTFAQVVAPTLKLLDGGPKAVARRPGPDAPHAAAAEHAAEPAQPEARSWSGPLTGLAAFGWWPTQFYRGPIARRIDAWSRANGGLIRYRRPGHARHPGRGAGRRRVPRPLGLQVRPVDPGPVPARGPPDPRGLRPRALGHNSAAGRPRDGRGDEARPGRPRHLLRRPALRGGPDPGAARPGVCLEAAGPDRPGPRLARTPARRPAVGEGPARSRRGPGGAARPDAGQPRRATRRPAWSPTGGATWWPPRPAAGRASWPATPASGWAAGCRASTSGPAIPT